MRIKKVAYTDADQTEFNRWIDHVIEEVILRQLDLEVKGAVQLRTAKYMDSAAGRPNSEEDDDS